MIIQTLHTPPITAEELGYPQVILGVIYFITFSFKNIKNHRLQRKSGNLGEVETR